MRTSLNIAPVIIISGLLVGCARSTELYTQDGRVGYQIDCSGSAMTWGACYQKAGELCGARGYQVIGVDGSERPILTATQFGIIAGSMVTRTAVIMCNN